MRTHEKHHVVCDYGVGLYWLFAFDRKTHDMMAGEKHAPLVVPDNTHYLVGIQGGFAPPR